jgi:hypothetical protein
MPARGRRSCKRASVHVLGKGDRMIAKPRNVQRVSRSTIALCVMFLLFSAWIGVLYLRMRGMTAPLLGFDTPAAEQLTQHYLMAISTADAAGAKQICKHAEEPHITQEITMWGDSAIRDLQFSALERTSPSYGPVRILDVRFSYQRRGQTTWAPGFLRMFWVFRDGTFWTMPSAETCDGSNGYDAP